MTEEQGRKILNFIHALESGTDEQNEYAEKYVEANLNRVRESGVNDEESRFWESVAIEIGIDKQERYEVSGEPWMDDLSRYEQVVAEMDTRDMDPIDIRKAMDEKKQNGLDDFTAPVIPGASPVIHEEVHQVSPQPERQEEVEIHNQSIEKDQNFIDYLETEEDKKGFLGMKIARARENATPDSVKYWEELAIANNFDIEDVVKSASDKHLDDELIYTDEVIKNGHKSRTKEEISEIIQTARANGTAQESINEVHERENNRGPELLRRAMNNEAMGPEDLADLEKYLKNDETGGKEMPTDDKQSRIEAAWEQRGLEHEARVKREANINNQFDAEGKRNRTQRFLDYIQNADDKKGFVGMHIDRARKIGSQEDIQYWEEVATANNINIEEAVQAADTKYRRDEIAFEQLFPFKKDFPSDNRIRNQIEELKQIWNNEFDAKPLEELPTMESVMEAAAAAVVPTAPAANNDNASAPAENEEERKEEVVPTATEVVPAAPAQAAPAAAAAAAPAEVEVTPEVAAKRNQQMGYLALLSEESKKSFIGYFIKESKKAGDLDEVNYWENVATQHNFVPAEAEAVASNRWLDEIITFDSMPNEVSEVVDNMQRNGIIDEAQAEGLKVNQEVGGPTLQFTGGATSSNSGQQSYSATTADGVQTNYTVSSAAAAAPAEAPAAAAQQAEQATPERLTGEALQAAIAERREAQANNMSEEERQIAELNRKGREAFVARKEGKLLTPSQEADLQAYEERLETVRAEALAARAEGRELTTEQKEALATMPNENTQSVVEQVSMTDAANAAAGMREAGDDFKSAYESAHAMDELLTAQENEALAVDVDDPNELDGQLGIAEFFNPSAPEQAQPAATDAVAGENAQAESAKEEVKQEAVPAAAGANPAAPATEGVKEEVEQTRTIAGQQATGPKIEKLNDKGLAGALHPTIARAGRSEIPGLDSSSSVTTASQGASQSASTEENKLSGEALQAAIAEKRAEQLNNMTEEEKAVYELNKKGREAYAAKKDGKLLTPEQEEDLKKYLDRLEIVKGQAIAARMAGKELTTEQKEALAMVTNLEGLSVEEYQQRQQAAFADQKNLVDAMESGTVNFDHDVKDAEDSANVFVEEEKKELFNNGALKSALIGATLGTFEFIPDEAFPDKFDEQIAVLDRWMKEHNFQVTDLPESYQVYIEEIQLKGRQKQREQEEEEKKAAAVIAGVQNAIDKEMPAGPAATGATSSDKPVAGNNGLDKEPEKEEDKKRRLIPVVLFKRAGQKTLDALKKHKTKIIAAGLAVLMVFSMRSCSKNISQAHTNEVEPIKQEQMVDENEKKPGPAVVTPTQQTPTKEQTPTVVTPAQDDEKKPDQKEEETKKPDTKEEDEKKPDQKEEETKKPDTQEQDDTKKPPVEEETNKDEVTPPGPGPTNEDPQPDPTDPVKPQTEEEIAPGYVEEEVPGYTDTFVQLTPDDKANDLNSTSKQEDATLGGESVRYTDPDTGVVTITDSQGRITVINPGQDPAEVTVGNGGTAYSYEILEDQKDEKDGDLVAGNTVVNPVVLEEKEEDQKVETVGIIVDGTTVTTTTATNPAAETTYSSTEEDKEEVVNTTTQTQDGVFNQDGTLNQDALDVVTAHLNDLIAGGAQSNVDQNTDIQLGSGPTNVSPEQAAQMIVEQMAAAPQVDSQELGGPTL